MIHKRENCSNSFNKQIIRFQNQNRLVRAKEFKKKIRILHSKTKIQAKRTRWPYENQPEDENSQEFRDYDKAKNLANEYGKSNLSKR